jgi:CRISPR/Cas system-associated exonuclease Cas4 (RecB family)
MIIQFDKKNHKFTVDGVEAPGVTTVQEKIWGPYDGPKECGLIGSAVHAACEDYVNGVSLLDVYESTHGEDITVSIFNNQKTYNLREMVSAFVSFCTEHNVLNTPVWSEKIVANKEIVTNESPLIYAGIVDLVLPERKAIIDIKTGNLHKKKHFMQLRAYSAAIESTYNIEIDSLNLVKLNSDGTYELKTMKMSIEKDRIYLNKLYYNEFMEALLEVTNAHTKLLMDFVDTL